MAKNWPLPEDTNTKRDAFVEYQQPVVRTPLTDIQVADVLGVGVVKAHEIVESVTERRSVDLDE
jgi:hypothetical protein